MVEGEQVVYVCPSDECQFKSMMPGKCRSHPYPCRGMGPQLVPLKVVPTSAASLQEAVEIARVNLDKYEEASRGA